MSQGIAWRRKRRAIMTTAGPARRHDGVDWSFESAFGMETQMRRRER